MTNEQTQTEVVRTALDQHEHFLSNLENVHSLGIVELKEIGQVKFDTDSDIDSDDDGTPKKQARHQQKPSEYFIAVYVSKKLTLDQLETNQIVPKTLSVEFKGKSFTVKTTVIEQPVNQFEFDSFGADSFGVESL